MIIEALESLIIGAAALYMIFIAVLVGLMVIAVGFALREARYRKGFAILVLVMFAAVGLGELLDEIGLRGSGTQTATEREEHQRLDDGDRRR